MKRTTCFCEANPRQLRVTFVVILNLFQDLIICKGWSNIVKTDSSGFALRMMKNIYRHTEALAEVSIRWVDPTYGLSLKQNRFFGLRPQNDGMSFSRIIFYLQVRSLYSTILYRKFDRKMFELSEILFVRIIFFTPYNKA